MKLTSLNAIGYVLATVCFWPPNAAAAIANETIDDELGDSITGLQPVYFPVENVWNDQTCGSSKCAINPVVDKAFGRTYTAATYQPAMGSIGISMTFHGTAIYVFFILANNQGDGITTLTSANFTVDGNVPVPFTHTPDLSTPAIQYNVLVFCQTNLTNALHKLDITISGPNSIYVNFDYATYTHDNVVSAISSSPFAATPTFHKLSTSDIVSTTSSSPSAVTSKCQESSTSDAAHHSTTATGVRTPVGIIVGGIAGAIVALILVIFLLFCWRRREGHDALQMDTGKGDFGPGVTDFEGHHDSIWQRDNGNERPAPSLIEVNDGPSPSAASVSRTSYTQPSFHSKASMADVTPQTANQIGDYVFGYSGKEGWEPSKRYPQPGFPTAPNGAEGAYGVQNDHGMAYGNAVSESFWTDYESNMSNDYQTLCSREVILYPPGSARSSSSTYNSGGLSASDSHCTSRAVATRPNIGTEIQEEICYTRQELNSQLRMLQQEMLGLQELSIGPGRLEPLRRRTAGEADVIGKEADVPEPNMKEAIQSLKEQIRVLRELAAVDCASPGIV